jgi:hypothetical protein
MLTKIRPTEIMEDVKEECEKYGKVVELKIPRPSGGRSVPGVGKVFVKFEVQESAQKALRALAGRKFADRTVVVTYFGEVRLSSTLNLLFDNQRRPGILRCQCLVIFKTQPLREGHFKCPMAMKKCPL